MDQAQAMAKKLGFSEECIDEVMLCSVRPATRRSIPTLSLLFTCIILCMAIQCTCIT